MADPAPAATSVAVKLEQQKIITLPAAVLGLDASADGKTAIAACMDGGVYTVDVDSGR